MTSSYNYYIYIYPHIHHMYVHIQLYMTYLYILCIYYVKNVDQGIGVKIFFKINKLLHVYNTCTYKYNNIYLFYIHVCIQRVLHT